MCIWVFKAICHRKKSSLTVFNVSTPPHLFPGGICLHCSTERMPLSDSLRTGTAIGFRASREHCFKLLVSSDSSLLLRCVASWMVLMPNWAGFDIMSAGSFTFWRVVSFRATV